MLTLFPATTAHSLKTVPFISSMQKSKHDLRQLTCPPCSGALPGARRCIGCEESEAGMLSNSHPHLAPHSGFSRQRM